MWFVYLIQCKGDTIYTGITNDLKKRFNDHKEGKGAKYTRANKPVKILYSEKFKTKSEASKREFEIKNWSREEKLRLIKNKF
jgi:putative endonuclease